MKDSTTVYVLHCTFYIESSAYPYQVTGAGRLNAK
jgi:hypothetical protein